jgi:hypothetical protein
MLNSLVLSNASVPKSNKYLLGQEITRNTHQQIPLLDLIASPDRHLLHFACM